MDKIERDGKVAVLYSPGFGAGWSTWGDESCREALCMDARIVGPVLAGDINAAVAAATAIFPDVYTGGASDLEVEWLEKDELFEIVEYDGSERIKRVGKNTRLMRA
jgi:hypothetical protein